MSQGFVFALLAGNISNDSRVARPIPGHVRIDTLHGRSLRHLQLDADPLQALRR